MRTGKVRRLLRAVNEACGIIELGDQRLLAGDGPAGSLPPELSLPEWCRLYEVLNEIRVTLSDTCAVSGAQTSEKP